MIGARFCSTSFRFSSDEDVSARQSEKVFSKTLVSRGTTENKWGTWESDNCGKVSKVSRVTVTTINKYLWKNTAQGNDG